MPNILIVIVRSIKSGAGIHFTEFQQMGAIHFTYKLHLIVKITSGNEMFSCNLIVVKKFHCIVQIYNISTILV